MCEVETSKFALTERTREGVGLRKQLGKMNCVTDEN